MKIIEKVRLSNQGSRLYFFKEGIFYRLYNQSAFLFVENIKSYTVGVKFIKNINDWIYTIGFPIAYFNTDVLKASKLLEEKPSYRCYSFPKTAIASEYEQWCLQQQSQSEQRFKSKSESMILQKPPTNLIQEILQFDTLNKTPMQAMEFIAFLKSKIKGTDG